MAATAKDSAEVQEARAAALKAETKKFQAEARRELAEAKLQEILVEREEDQREVERAGDAHHHVYVFDDEVSERSVKACIDQLATWHRTDPDCDMEIQINSPGGSIFDGFALIDYIRDLREKGHEITIVALGMAASMAGVILQSGTTRIMGENCLLLVHEGSFGAIGDFGEVQDRVKMMALLHEKILDLFATRAQPINKKTTKAFIKRNWKRKDWWIPAEEALALGFVDKVR